MQLLVDKFFHYWGTSFFNPGGQMFKNKQQTSFITQPLPPLLG
jgi:hypothetical protein